MYFYREHKVYFDVHNIKYLITHVHKHKYIYLYYYKHVLIYHHVVVLEQV